MNDSQPRSVECGGSNATARNNIVILTIGRSGSTIVCRMLEQLGWNLPDADEFAEPVSLRQLNTLCIRTGQLDLDAARQLVQSYPQPWCLKDPRFVHTLPQWEPLFEGAALVWVQRDLADVEQSLRRRNWGQEINGVWHLRGLSLEQTERTCQRLYDTWTGPTYHCHYEQLTAAVNLFDSSTSSRSKS